jgi:hypothetical protein
MAMDEIRSYSLVVAKKHGNGRGTKKRLEGL